MKTLQMALLLVISVFVLMIVALFSAPSFINWNNNKGFVENIISDYTGYKAKINGNLQVQIFPNPNIYAEDIVFESMSGDEKLATVNRIIIDKKLSELLTLDFKINDIVINRPEINLEVNESGNRNWEPIKVKNANYYGPKLKALVDSVKTINSISIENGSLNYINKETSKEDKVSNIYSSIKTVDNKIVVDGKADVNDEEYSLNLHFNPRTESSARIVSKLTVGEDIYALEGIINTLYNFRKINYMGKMTAQVKDANKIKLPATLEKLKNRMFDIKNLETQAEIDVSPDEFKANIASFDSDDQKLSGKVSYKKTNGNTNVTLDLDILKLVAKESLYEDKSIKKKSVWSDELLDFSFLSNVSYNVAIACEECVYGDKVFRQISFTSSLENNNLNIRQLNVKSKDGGFLKLTATAGLNSPVALETKLDASNFPLPSLMPSMFKGMDFNLDGHLDFIATGISPKAMVSNMSGAFKFSTLNTVLSGVNPRSIKTLADSVFKDTSAKGTAHLGNVGFEGIIRDGVLRTSDIIFRFNNSNVISKGKFDLANLTMSYRVEPEYLSRNNLGIVMSGNLHDLDIVEDKITPKGVINGFGRVVSSSIVKKKEREQIKTPFDFQDRRNLDENIKNYLFNEK